MLEARSPLFKSAAVEVDGAKLREVSGLVLTQVAGESSALTKALGKLPANVGKSMARNGQVFMRIAPKQVWIIGSEVPAAAGIYHTPLSSGRTRFLLEGSKSRQILSALAPIDFHPNKFKPDDFVMTGVHHLPVLIHCIGEDAFHVFVLRSFAQDLWEWIADAMLS
jgi:methylglutamate dehydrogenase subunit D